MFGQMNGWMVVLLPIPPHHSHCLLSIVKLPPLITQGLDAPWPHEHQAVRVYQMQSLGGKDQSLVLFPSESALPAYWGVRPKSPKCFVCSPFSPHARIKDKPFLLRPITSGPDFLLFGRYIYLFIFNRRIITLQCCAGFCHIST